MMLDSGGCAECVRSTGRLMVGSRPFAAVLFLERSPPLGLYGEVAGGWTLIAL